MKRLLLLIVFVGSVLNASAQSGLLQSDSTSVDVVSQKLANLQRSYDFMTCDYELFKLITDLKDLSSSLDIASNGALINAYHTKFDYELYDVYSNHYKSFCTLFDSLKKKTKSVKLMVLLKMEETNFTEAEISVLNSSFSLVDKATATAEKALDYYDIVIKAYKSKM